MNLTNCSEAQIQVKKILCDFVPSVIEITDLKRGNIVLRFSDFEFLNLPNPSKAPRLLNDFDNSIHLLRIREALQDEDFDLSSFPPVLNIPKSVFAALPFRRWNPQHYRKEPSVF